MKYDSEFNTLLLYGLEIPHDSECEPNWNRQPGTDQCYIEERGDQGRGNTYHNALRYCEKLGASLPLIQNGEDNTYWTIYMNSKGYVS